MVMGHLLLAFKNKERGKKIWKRKKAPPHRSLPRGGGRQLGSLSNYFLSMAVHYSGYMKGKGRKGKIVRAKKVPLSSPGGTSCPASIACGEQRKEGGREVEGWGRTTLCLRLAITIAREVSTLEGGGKKGKRGTRRKGKAILVVDDLGSLQEQKREEKAAKRRKKGEGRESVSALSCSPGVSSNISFCDGEKEIYDLSKMRKDQA